MSARRVVLCFARIGRSAYVEDLSEELPGRGFDPVWVHADPGPSATLERVRERGQRVEEVPPASLWNPLPRAVAVGRVLRRVRPALLHAHFFPDAALDLGVARLLGVPATVQTRNHSTYHHRFFPKAVPVDRLAGTLAHRVIAISRIVRRVLVERERIPREKISLVHYGLDPERFRVPDARVRAFRARWGLEGPGPLLGMLSRYVRLKGIQHVLEALPGILSSAPDARLLLANAGGPYQAELRRRIRRLPAGAVVEIPFEQDVEALYAALDVCLHVPDDPWIEAFGQVYLEALAAGVPSVMTRSGIGHELLNDGVNSLVVPHRAPAEITRAVLRLLDEPGLRRRISEAAVASVGAYTVDRMVDGIAGVYDAALE